MATSRFEGSDRLLTVDPDDLTPEEIAAIETAIERLLAEEALEDGEQGMSDPWRLTARLEAVARDRVDLTGIDIADPWRVAGRLDRR